MDWFDKLNDSPWMGSICEVGMGLPFQSAFMSKPGASKTIFFTHCPYSKAFQPEYIERSVSEQMAMEYVAEDFEKIIRNVGAQERNIFSLAVTASHKVSGETGDSHGWVAVLVRDDSLEEIEYSFHFTLPKWLDRVKAGELLNTTIQWFLSKVLLNEWDTWEDAINSRHDFIKKHVGIDVIKAPDISIEDHLLLASVDNPLIYHNGSFQRTADYFRKYKRIFSGAFNPPTIRHFKLGDGALFCLDFYNPRKEPSTEVDIAHRLRMLDTESVPVLINRGRQFIVNINEIVVRRGMTNPVFIVGADTFNAVCNEKYIPSINFLAPLYRERGTSFLIVNRGDIEIVDNHWSRSIDFKVVKIDGDGVSSTRVRNGELDLTTSKIREYILEHKLY